MGVSLMEAHREVLAELRAGSMGKCCARVLFAGAAPDHDPVLLNRPER